MTQAVDIIKTYFMDSDSRQIDMPRVVDCLADTTVYQNESPDLCRKECERLGGENNCVYVFTSPVKCDKIKELVRGTELTLF